MLIFVGWRESILAGIVIPLTLLVTVIILNSMGLTFNGVSLFSLVLGIGLLVDNAIVVVEGMSEAINDKKYSETQSTRIDKDKRKNRNTL